MMKRKSFLAAVFLSCASMAIADVPGGSGNYADLVYKHEGGGKVDATTKLGSASGKYQFTYSTLKSLGFIESGPGNVPSGAGEWANVRWTGKGGVHSRQQFLNNEAAQDLALGELTQSNWNFIQSKVPVGTVVNGVEMSQGGALFAAHMLGAGGFNQWASCGFQAHCLNDGQASANNMSKEQFQAHLMKRMAAGGGYDPSVIASSGGDGLGGGIPVSSPPSIVLMPWT